jgi:hypothetical protein
VATLEAFYRSLKANQAELETQRRKRVAAIST